MQCKCGGATQPCGHDVKTLKKAQEWDETVTEADLPIRVELDRCEGCGRQESLRITKGV